MHEAIEEATQSINRDKRVAAQTYLEMSGEKESLDSIVQFLSDPDIDYSPIPHKLKEFAEFKYTTGLIKVKPTSLQDLFFTTDSRLQGD